MDLFDLFDQQVRDKAKATLLNPYPLLDLSQNTRAIKDDSWAGHHV
jgi:hypothetical protein